MQTPEMIVTVTTELVDEEQQTHHVVDESPAVRSGPRRVVIESPYAGKFNGDQAMVEHHLRYLRACMRDCFARGEAPYASHGLYTQPGVLDDNDPAERQLGIDAGFAWRNSADATVVYVDIGRTKGMEYGIADANAKGRPIEFRTLGENWYDPSKQTTARWGCLMLARLLGKFADWTLRKYPAPPMTSSSKPTQFAAYTIMDYISDSKYLTRVLFPKVFGIRPMLHHIHRPDYARDPHNHPWDWAFSIVLCGSYDEERLDAAGRSTKRHVKRFNLLRRTDFHKITELHGDVWTLFIIGKSVQHWGFVRMIKVLGSKALAAPMFQTHEEYKAQNLRELGR